MKAIGLGVTLALLALSLASLGIEARGEASFDDPAFQSPHGGQMRTAGPYHLELIANAGEIIVYVTDHGGRPVETAGGKGKAVIHTDGHGMTLPLGAVDGNVLKGKGRFKLKRSSVVYVMVDLRREKPHNATFRPLVAAPPGAPGKAKR